MVALILHLSSCLILDLTSPFGQKRLLTALNPFLEYEHGQCRPPGKHAFQSLIFLHRDWEKTKSLSFGETFSIQTFIDSQLLFVKSNFISSQMFSKAFSKVQCFLLPSMGNDLLKKGFEGKHIHPRSLPFIESFIWSILNQNSLLHNQIGDKKITPRKMQSFVHQFISNVAEKNLSGRQLCQNVNGIINASLLASAQKNYRGCMINKLEKFDFVSAEKLEEIHEDVRSLVSAQIMYQANITCSLEELSTALINKFEEFKEENQQRSIVTLSDAKKSILSDYQESLKNQTTNEDPMEPTCFVKFSTLLISKALSKLQTKYLNRGNWDTSKQVALLKTTMEDLTNTFRSINEQKFLEAEMHMDTLVNSLAQEYEWKMIGNDSEEERKICRLQIIKAFDADKKYKNKEFREKFKSLLISKLQMCFQKTNESKILVSKAEPEISIRSIKPNVPVQCKAPASSTQPNISVSSMQPNIPVFSVSSIQPNIPVASIQPNIPVSSIQPNSPGSSSIRPKAPAKIVPLMNIPLEQETSEKFDGQKFVKTVLDSHETQVVTMLQEMLDQTTNMYLKDLKDHPDSGAEKQKMNVKRILESQLNSLHSRLLAQIEFKIENVDLSKTGKKGNRHFFTWTQPSFCLVCI